MNPAKFPAKAAELRQLVEEGDELPDTVAVVYDAALRKQLRKDWVLLNEHLDVVEEKLAALADAQDECFQALDVLQALSEYAGLLDAQARDEQPIEVVDAEPLPVNDE